MKNKLRQILLGSLILFAVSSCGVFKTVNKTHKEEKRKTELKVDSTEKVDNKIGVKKEEVINDIETTTTETTTKKTTKGSDVKVSTNKDKLKENEELILLDSIGRKIVVLLDSLNLTIKVESPEVVEEKTVKETKQHDKSKKSSQDSTSHLNKHVAITKQEDKQEQIKDTSKKSEMKPFTIIALALGGVLMIVLTVFGLKKFVFKF